MHCYIWGLAILLWMINNALGVDKKAILLNNPEHQLLVAIDYSQLNIVDKLLDQDSIDVAYKSMSDSSLLHRIATVSISDSCTQSLYHTIIQKLINKGCSVNHINIFNTSPLETFYYQGCKNMPWEYRPTAIFIENGAELMMSKERMRWNILDLSLAALKKIDQLGNSYLPSLATQEKIVKDVLSFKFAYDYKSYYLGKEHFMLALIVHQLKSKKKIFVPKPLVKYIAAFIAPLSKQYPTDPTKNIEEALKDAWANQYPYKYTLLFKKLNKSLRKEIQARYSELISCITPGAWKKAWQEYQKGNRTSSNLVAQAFHYTRKK